MPRTLVTGATGFIGSHVTRLLVQRGDDVTVTVGPSARTEALDALPIRRLLADVLDRRAIRRAMRGIDRVFHVAGPGSLRTPRAELAAIAVEGTRIVLEEALRAGVERAVYTSSVAAIGPAPRGGLADERTRWTGGHDAIPLMGILHEAEVAAMDLVSRGLPLVVVNPARVLGPGDTAGSCTRLVRRFLARQIPAYVDGTLNVVAVQDVARGHLLADERGRIGERYILGNRNFTTTRLFADLGRLSGVQPPELRLPLPVALALTTAGRRLGGLPLPTGAEVRAAAMNWSFSNRKAKRELGWTTSPHEDCLEETVAWYRERARDQVAPPGSMQPLALRVTGGALRRVGW